MREALNEAYRAFERDEVPVGAVLEYQNQIIARSHNLTQTLCNATAHAEMQIIASAGSIIGSKYLSQCTLYVTLEPCCMCAGALFWAQLGTLIYGTSDPKRGYSLTSTPLLHPKTQVLSGILAQECSILMTNFFKLKRKNSS
jgi:tRNA(adenine34) deaminase